MTVLSTEQTYAPPIEAIQPLSFTLADLREAIAAGEPPEYIDMVGAIALSQLRQGGDEAPEMPAPLVFEHEPIDLAALGERYLGVRAVIIAEGRKGLYRR